MAQMQLLENTKAIWTDVGRAKIAASLESGESLRPAYIVLGTGGGQPYKVDPTQTKLVEECYRAPIIKMYEHSKDPGHLILWAGIPSDVTGFVIREWGVVDFYGDLISVGEVPEFTKADPGAYGITFDMLIKYHLIFKNEVNYEIVIDPTTALATIEDLWELEDKLCKEPVMRPIPMEKLEKWIGGDFSE